MSRSLARYTRPKNSSAKLKQMARFVQSIDPGVQTAFTGTLTQEAMRRKFIRLQSKFNGHLVRFFTPEFDAIVIPPFEASDMVNRRTRKIIQKNCSENALLGALSPDQQGRGIRGSFYYPE
ncbi:hypothetical protein G9A89_020441 [Geosiphon pyriformis]|nr:hypothetical protein G9A89_020441 [Geosiphon pyriformis]